VALLEDLGGYLDTNSALVTLGTNLFYGLMPETVANCVTLYESGGAPPLFTQGTVNLPVMERPQLQMLVRNAVYATGRSTAEELYRILTAITNQTVNGNHYLRVEAISVPSLIERDANKRAVFSCNFDVLRTLP